MQDHTHQAPHEPHGAPPRPRERDDVRTQRRRLIRTLLVGGPALVAASAKSAHASNGYGYTS